MFDLFQDENATVGLPVSGQFQKGISDYDPLGTPVEQGITLPWADIPDCTWIYYECGIDCLLDSGIVVHRHLPQSRPSIPASLAACLIDDPTIDRLNGPGVNLKSLDDFQDVVQQMAHAQYWFRLSGQAMRLGYQVPIPGMKTVGGVPAIPHDDNPQFGRNWVVGNYSGVIVWRAAWSLWYTVAVPPSANQLPPPNLAAHISADTPLPAGMQAPFSQPDDEAESTNPLGNIRPRAVP